MSTIEMAIQIAIDAHKGQVDKAGEPYILHPLRVMMNVSGEAEKIVAVLHDVIEDSAVTLADLERSGFSKEVCAAVGALTKAEQEDYDAYLQRVRQNPIAHRVKLADLTDNMDLQRLPELSPDSYKRMSKYHHAWTYLNS